MSELGVDPGYDGAIAVNDSAHGVFVIPMPVIPDPDRPGKVKARVYDMTRINEALEPHTGGRLWIERAEMFPMVQPTCRKCRGYLGCPKCGTIAPKQKNATAAASQQRCHTLFEVLCKVHGIRFNVVPARVWQTAMLGAKRGDDRAKRKRLSIARANEKYPDVSLLRTTRSRKPSDGFSDALAIMEFGSRATIVA